MSLLRQKRDNLNLTQEEVAASIGTSPGYYRRLEADRAMPSRDMLYRLLELFGLGTPADLGFKLYPTHFVERIKKGGE